MIVFAALALQAVSHQPLWKDLFLGMTKDEVQALYPTGKTMLTPDCGAKVLPSYSKGRLSGVALRFGDLYAAGRSQWDQALKCQEVVKASIVAKYGEPVKTGMKVGLPPLRSISDQYLFVSGKTQVLFTVQRGRPFTVVEYFAIETPAPVKPDAAGNL